MKVKAIELHTEQKLLKIWMLNEYFKCMDIGKYIWIETKITPKANVVLIIFHLGKVPAKNNIKTRRKKFFFCFIR